ncbi:MAG: alpha-galactosidase [Halothiobacillaceae bacterium]
MQPTLLCIDGNACSAVLELDPSGVVLWRHLGSRLHALDLLAAWPGSDLLCIPPGGMDAPSPPCLAPGHGNGAAQDGVLRAHRDGREAIHDWSLEAWSQPSADTLSLQLGDLHAELGLHIELHLDPDTDVLRVEGELHNRADSVLQVDRLAAASIALPQDLSVVCYPHGEWAGEFQWSRAEVGAAGWSRENRRGRSSHQAPPALFVLSAGGGEHAGAALGAQLAWSGNHRFAIERHDDGRLLLQAGEWFAPGEMRLSPGARLRVPALYLALAQDGIGSASRALHALTRRSVLRWPGGMRRARPVHLNTWEALYFRHDEAALRDLAGRAAQLGVERFVLDDGWFEGRDDDRAALGDWWPDPRKYPEGLGPLVAHVRSLGMEFGLWVEPEMVNPDSRLYREHPDWVLGDARREPVFGRHQLVLDLSRPEVSEYLYERLDALLRGAEISYLKWDMNRDLAQALDAHGRPALHAQVQALYALLGRLREVHPWVEIESCASGGARADLGILRHTHRLWISDNNDAVSRIAIQSGALRLFPPELLGSHVGPSPAHATGRSQSIDLRCAVACFGHMGVEADVRAMSADEQERLRTWIAVYKQWRETIHGGEIDQGSSPTGARWWLASTPERQFLCVFQPEPMPGTQSAALRLPRLHGSGRWKVRLLGRAGQLRHRTGHPQAWLQALAGPGVHADGSELAQCGLPLPGMHPESALVFGMERA